MIFEAYVQGLASYTDPVVMGFLLLGIVIGIVFGIIPAIGGLVAMTLLLPLVFGMDKVAALSMLVGIYAIGSSGDAVASILMGVPGSGPATCVLLDGFPLTKKGQAGRALGVMFGSDMMGSLLGVVLALALVPLIRPIVMAFGSPEMFLLVLLGLSFLAVLSRGSAVKGLMAGFCGILLALVGFQYSTGVDRFTLGIPSLIGGLQLIPIVLGLFAGAEMVELAVMKRSISSTHKIATGKEFRRQFWRGWGEVIEHKWLWLRSCVLGYVLGSIPGIGSEVAVWVSYGQAKQTSKNRDMFGKGAVEGIIGPQSANNAKEGAGLLSTMALGLPTGAAMAIFLGALMLQGVTPGPSMLINDLELTFTLLWGLALANVVGLFLLYLLLSRGNVVAWLIGLPPHYLIPPVFALIFLGSYVSNSRIEALAVTIAFTGIGLVMKTYGYSRPAMILGFILGRHFETYFWLTIQTEGAHRFLGPASLTIITILIALYALGPVRSLLRQRRPRDRDRGAVGGVSP